MLTYTPFETLDPTQLHLDSRAVNVGPQERFASVLGGTVLIALGLSRRSLPGLLLAGLGGAFIFRGATGHCKMYDHAAGSGRSGVPGNHGSKIEKTILINRAPEEVYRFWRNLENLPEFMENLQSVRALDDRRSHWVVKGPAGSTVEWDAEIVNEHPNEMLSWQTLPGADVQSAGTVRFERSLDGRGTALRVVLEFRPPGGALGGQVAWLLGKNPAQQLDHDLSRLKTHLEAGQGIAAG